MTNMTKTEGHDSFTAKDAAETLRDLGSYEDTLNTRAGALTWMFFGMGAAGIFVTYEAGSQTLIELGLPWLLALLWIPWILGASIVTSGLWKMLAVTTSTEYDRRSTWLASIGGTLLFFAIAALIWVAAQAVDRHLTLDGSIVWVIVVGAFTATLAIYQGQRYSAPALRNSFVLAGAVLFLVGAAMSIWPPPGALPGLIGAGVTLLTYFAAALYVYGRG